MNQSYKVAIRNLSNKEDRDVVITSRDPMQAHKQVYLTTTKDEEILTIVDTDGKLVFEYKKGFRRNY